MARHAQRRRRAAAAAHAPIEEVETRAARLGITVERVLQEYASLAFADLRGIAEWGPGEDGLRIKPSNQIADADAVAVAEIVANASSGKIYRVKVHDKTPALGALGRYLGMVPALKTASNEDEQPDGDGESAVQRLIREFDEAAAAEAAAGPDTPETGK